MDDTPTGLVSVAEVLAYFGQDRFLDVREAVEYLPFSERTLREHIRRRDLPFYRVGGKLAFRKSELDEWMARFKVQAECEVDVEGIVDGVMEEIKQ